MVVERNKRVLPGWAGVGMLTIWALGLLILTLDARRDTGFDWRGWLTGMPFYLTLGYGLLCLAVTRVWSRVDAEGIHMGYGPLPLARNKRYFSNKEVAAFLFHLVRSKESRHYLVGFLTTDGRTLFLYRLWPLEKAIAKGQELSAVMQRPLQQLTGPMKPDWETWRPLLVWSVLGIGALLVSFVLEEMR